jgi:hypothetical protein
MVWLLTGLLLAAAALVAGWLGYLAHRLGRDAG